MPVPHDCALQCLEPFVTAAANLAHWKPRVKKRTTPATLLVFLVLAGCGNSTANTASGGSSGGRPPAAASTGCLVNGGCGSGSAACQAAAASIQTALGQTAKPTVEILSGVSAITTKADIARDKAKVRTVLVKVEALEATYETCPGADPKLAADIAALKTYLK